MKNKKTGINKLLQNKAMLLLIALVLGATYVNNLPTLSPSRHIASTVEMRDQVFKYVYKGQALEIKVSGKTWEEAFSKAASDCYKHYNPKFKSEDTSLDVIDVCANPR